MSNDINLVQVNIPFLFTLKTSENLVSRKGALGWNGLM